jgi:hypothetical protein
MPVPRLRPKTLREPPASVLDFLLLLHGALDEPKTPPAELAAVLRRALPAWQEDEEGVHQADTIARWCRQCGVAIPAWIKTALGGKLPPVPPPDEPDEDGDPLGAAIARRRAASEVS